MPILESIACSLSHWPYVLPHNLADAQCLKLLLGLDQVSQTESCRLYDTPGWEIKTCSPLVCPIGLNYDVDADAHIHAYSCDPAGLAQVSKQPKCLKVLKGEC